MRIDVLVAGGGAAGCAVAARMSENAERRVCLVEAGPDYGRWEDGRWPTDLLDGRRLALSSHAWERADENDRSQLRARVLGGCSAHNACVVLEGAPEDYDEWGPGWTFAEVAPFLARAEAQLGTRELRRDELSPWHAAFADGAGDDAILHRVNMRGTVRWNAAFAYLDEARGRPNLSIVADTVVDRVLLDGDRAVGVATDAGEIRADTVVLTAGAYGSPAILLRSGLGRERGLPVGEGLLDHVGVGMGFSGTPLLQEELRRWSIDHEISMAQVTVRARSTHCDPGLSDLFVFPALDPLADGDGWEASAAVFAMKPRSRGRVRLRSPDPRDPLLIDHGFLRDHTDAEVLTEGVELLRTTAARDPIAAFAGIELRPGPRTAQQAHVRNTARGFFHPTGTCALGAVVDAHGRVLGVEGLRVADASIMPTIPRANTHLSTLAVAEKIATLIEDD